MARLHFNQQTGGKSLPPGTMLKHYCIDSTYKQGKHAITYRAKDSSTGRDVLIKEHLPSAIAQRNASNLQVGPGTAGQRFDETLEAFRREAALLMQLKHPCITPVTDSFSTLGTAYYVMPVIPGQELSREFTSPGQLNEPRLLDLLRQLLSALDYLHSNRMLYCNLSPESIHITPEGTPVLTDFAPAQEGAGAPRIGSKITTTSYRAPEQLSGKKCAEVRSDIYALAATCHYLITGRNPEDTIQRMLDPESTPPLQGRSDLQGRFSDELLSSIDKGYALRATDRWQSAAEWLEALGGSPIPVTPAEQQPAQPAPALNTPPIIPVSIEAVQLPARRTGAVIPTSQPNAAAEPLPAIPPAQSLPPAPPVAPPPSVAPAPFIPPVPPTTQPSASDGSPSVENKPFFPTTRPPQPLTITVDADWYIKGRELMLQHRPFEAVQVYQQGHEAGCNDCTVQLALCYRDGIGAPIDHEQFIRLARELESRGCAAAYCLLACAYADGFGCDVNINKADAYAIRWARESAISLPDMSEDCRLRLRALGLMGTGMEFRWDAQLAASHGRIPPPISAAEAMREYLDTDPADKYQLKSTQWLRKAGEKEKAPAELINGLRAEMQQSMPYAAALLGLLLARDNSPRIQVEAEQLLTQAATQTVGSDFLWEACKRCQNSNLSQQLQDALQLCMQFGPSCQPATNTLPCRLYLQKPRFAGFIKAFNSDYVDTMSEAELTKHTITSLSAPSIKIFNTGDTPLQYLSLRLIQRGASQREFHLDGEIEAGQSLELDLSEYQLELANAVRLELWSPDNRLAQLTASPHIWRAHIPHTPPLHVYWEKGIFGGIILCLCSTGATLTNVKVHASETAASTPCTLIKNAEPVKIRKLSNGDSLIQRGEYIITLNEADPLLCTICTTRFDAEAGAMKVGKMAGNFLLSKITFS